MMPTGGVMPGAPGPMRAPNPMMNLQRAAVLRGGPPAPMPAPGGMAQPGGGLPGMGGYMGQQPMPAPQMPMQQRPMPQGPMPGPAQNLWAGPQGY